MISMPLSHGRGVNLPTTVIIHAMGEYIEAGEKDFPAWGWLNKEGISAHYLITPTGVVIQCREDDEIAWHARDHNTNSIGIEVLVAGEHTYETFIERIKTPWVYGEQYTALVGLSKRFEGLSFKRHSDVSPGRKFDPGDGFQWETFLKDIS